MPVVSQQLDVLDLVDDVSVDDTDDDLKAVLRLSMEENRQAELQMQMEEEMLQQILQLSLSEK